MSFIQFLLSINFSHVHSIRLFCDATCLNKSDKYLVGVIWLDPYTLTLTHRNEIIKIFIYKIKIQPNPPKRISFQLKKNIFQGKKKLESLIDTKR